LATGKVILPCMMSSALALSSPLKPRRFSTSSTIWNASPRSSKNNPRPSICASLPPPAIAPIRARHPAGAPVFSRCTASTRSSSSAESPLSTTAGIIPSKPSMSSACPAWPARSASKYSS
jgi:hypothetical protein